MPSLVVGALLGTACLYALLRSVLRLTQDAREPPSVEDGIPFLGPVISMLTQKSQLYPNLKKKYNLGIYTLRFPAARLYVVNATALLPALQKNWRLVSFTPIVAHSGTAMGVTKEGLAAMTRDMTSDANPVVASMPIIARALGPGAELDRMNARAVEVVVAGMEKLRAGGGGATTLRFWEWAHHEIFMATTEAVYGPLNPYRKKSVEDAWNIFGPNYLNLFLSPFKTITARRAHDAREHLVSAWRDYILAGGPAQGSAFVSALHEHNAAHGFCLDDLSRFHVGQSFAIISSTGPAAWWLMYHIFSDPQVLSDVRGELSALVQVTTDDDDDKKAEKDGGDGDNDDDDGGKSCTIDLAAMQDACPILVSTFKETMRHHSIGSAVRVCLEDTFLDDDSSPQNHRVLMKKGSLVIAPQPVHHADPPTWGPDARAFDHLRFVRRPGRPRPDPVAFRAFGGGRHLCPGRHFSAREVMAQAALLALMFDVAPVGGEPWPEPTCEKTPMLSPFQIPDEDVEVEITPRDKRKWNVRFSESKQSTSIVSEDMKAE